ncbi:MAG: adenylate/guanylate cyclase domain-containing protein [Deltaproteobacteria bacterium]|jgi:class 3 adenylate cyclase/CHASE2 domain-containing sensor protein|nr:adenylate/guanylate cyclase domain-containing protein [Deltaproteobacteria bacterium]
MLTRLVGFLEKASAARLRISIPAGIILSLIGLALALPGTNLPLEGLVYDLMLTARIGAAPLTDPANIVIIAIDDLSLNNPRQSHPEFFSPGVYSYILEALTLGGAKTVAILQNLPSNESRYYTLSEESMWFQSVQTAHKAGLDVIYGFRWLQGRPIRPAPKFMAIMGYEKLGFVNLHSDRDGKLRSQNLTIPDPESTKDDPKNFYSWAYLAARAVDPQLQVFSQINYIDYSGSFLKFSFADIFTKAVDGEVDFFKRHFKDALVLIGPINSLNVDAYPTPLSAFDRHSQGWQVMSAVEIQAHAIRTYLSRRHLLDPGLGTLWFFFLGLSILALLPLILSRPKSAYPLAWFTPALTLIYLLAAYQAFKRFVYLPVVPGLIILTLAQAVYWALRLFETFQVQTASRRALNLYLDPVLSGQIIEDPQILTRLGEQRQVTVFFSDLAGFTAMAETRDTAEVVEILNRYYETMTEAIEQYGGFVDKFVGDAIMAFWGAPKDEPEQAVLACLSALKQNELMTMLNREMEASNKPCLSSLMGLNTGLAIAGNIGARRHKNYTVLGDTVNLASRLVAVNKIFHTTIVVSEATKILAEKVIAFRTLDQVRVPGRQQSLKIYEVMAEAGKIEPNVALAVGYYERALKHFWKLDFTGALTRFEAALKVKPDDLPSRLFIDRCRLYIQSPPASDWNGITSLDLRKTHVEENGATPG